MNISSPTTVITRVGQQPIANNEETTYTPDQTAFLDTAIDGQTFRFWITAAVIITATTLLVGVWWT